MTTPEDLWLLRGLLLCDRCGQPMTPAYHPGSGTRAYSCGQTCLQPDLAATRVEQDMLLGALVRGATTLHDDLGQADPAPGALPWLAGPQPPVDERELRRWQQCDVRDRRAVLHAAYVAVRVTVRGAVRPVWRHDTVDLAARVMATVGAS